MRARHVLIDALLTIKAKAAVQTVLDHIMDLLRLCRGDNVGVRSMLLRCTCVWARTRNATILSNVSYWPILSTWGHSQLSKADIQKGGRLLAKDRITTGETWTIPTSTSKMLMLSKDLRWLPTNIPI